MEKKKFFVISLVLILIMILFILSSCAFLKDKLNYLTNFSFVKSVGNFFSIGFIKIKNFVAIVFKKIKFFFKNIINFINSKFKNRIKNRYEIKNDKFPSKKTYKKFDFVKSKNIDDFKMNFNEKNLLISGKRIYKDKLNTDYILGIKYFCFILNLSYFEALHNFIENIQRNDFVFEDDNYNKEPDKLFQDERNNVFYSFIFDKNRIYIFFKKENLSKFFQLKNSYISEFHQYGFYFSNTQNIKKSAIYYYYYYSYKLDRFYDDVFVIKKYKRFTNFEIFLFFTLLVIIFLVLIFFDKYYSYFLEYKTIVRTNKKLEKTGKIIDNNINKSKKEKIRTKKNKNEKKSNNVSGDKNGTDEELQNIEDEILNL